MDETRPCLFVHPIFSASGAADIQTIYLIVILTLRLTFNLQCITMKCNGFQIFKEGSTQRKALQIFVRWVEGDFLSVL